MDRFLRIAEQFFHIKKEEYHDDLAPKDIPDWDSMSYLLFIAELEKEFSISFTMDEAIGAKNIGDVRKALISHKVEL